MSSDTDAPTISGETFDSMFGEAFADIEGYAPDSTDELARNAGFRITVGDSVDFVTHVNDNPIPASMKLNRAMLTALSYGEQTSRRTDSRYYLVQGQMRINAELSLHLDGEEVPLSHVLYSIFTRYAAKNKVEDWPFDRFVEFMRNSNYPIDGDYIFNFELLGAHEPAIEKYFKMFKDAGAVSIERQNRPRYVIETLEFRDNNVALPVNTIEIGNGDPTQSQYYGKKFIENGEEKVYTNSIFVDPIQAQMHNFHRFLTHRRMYAILTAKAKEADNDEIKAEILDQATKNRGMAVQLLSNFGGVHRGIAGESGDADILIPEDTYYLNRVRCGRFVVQLGEGDQEFNFWQPNRNAATMVAASNAESTEAKAEDKTEEVSDDDPFV